LFLSSKQIEIKNKIYLSPNALRCFLFILEAVFVFQTLAFDAILLIGALVHVTPAELPIILKRILAALRPAGHLLLTLKEGTGTRNAEDGRVFTLWQDKELKELFPVLGLQVLFQYRQLSQLRPTDIWLEYRIRQNNRICFSLH